MPESTASVTTSRLTGAGRNPAAPARIVAWSHFNEPIDLTPGRLFGRSRRWGDIDRASRISVIDELLGQAHSRGMKNSDTALLLAIARVESGFNPDAAAVTSSAAGLGQFINRTGSALGITAQTRFNLKENVSAMLRYIGESIRYARKDVSSPSADITPYIYAHYHDGPTLGSGGLQISQSQVLPWRDRFEAILNRNSSSAAEEIDAALGPP